MGPFNLDFWHKKENKRRKAQLVIGGHIVDALHLPPYSSVVQGLSIRLLLLVGKANDLKITTRDVGNTYLNVSLRQKVHSRASTEWRDRKGYAIEIIRTLSSSQTSSR